MDMKVACLISLYSGKGVATGAAAHASWVFMGVMCPPALRTTLHADVSAIRPNRADEHSDQSTEGFMDCGAS
eukprot:360737-Chlamydomonas_euryale.AAC.6